MKSLHPLQLEGTHRLPPELPVALLTRHSVREQADSTMAGYHVPLTAEGVQLAEAWGRQLPRPVSGCWSSPVGRCRDTASALLRGADQLMPVELSPLLVEPGCFVHDAQAVLPRFFELGPVAFANLHLSEPLEGIYAPQAGVLRILEHIQASLGEAGTMSIHVTHDTILAAFIYGLMGCSSLSGEDWTWMMEGAWVWLKDHEVFWIWRGRYGHRLLSELK